MFLPFPLRLEEDIQIRITEKLVHIFHVVILTENKNSFLRGSESDLIFMGIKNGSEP